MAHRFSAHAVRLFALLALSASLSAQTLVVDRGLPSTLRQTSGRQRVGVRLGWPSDQQEFIGDDFKIGASGETWIIDNIRTWAVVPGPNHSQNPGDLYGKVALYGGMASDPIRDDKTRAAECECHGLVVLKAANLQPGTPSSGNSDILLAPVDYRDGIAFEEGGKPFSVWQIDFQNLQWSVPGGEGIQFAIRGTGRTVPGKNTNNTWFNYGSPIKGAHRLRVFDHRALPKSFLDEASRIRDRSIGINVQVWAHLMANANPTR